MKDISRDERFFYQRSSTPLLLRCGIWLAALVCTAVTVSLIPLSDLVKPRVGKIIDYRPVDTVTWRPKPPPPPRPETRRKPEPPKPKPKAEAARNRPPERAAPTSPKLKLPIKLDFSMAPAVGDFELDFEIDPTVTVLPEVIETPEPEPEPEEKSLYELNELDTAPTIVSQSRPVYPYRARTRGIEGYVDVEFTVRPDGTTANIAVSGSKPPGVFEKAASQAVETWRFSPGIRKGTAVDARVRLRILFALD